MWALGNSIVSSLDERVSSTISSPLASSTTVGASPVFSVRSARAPTMILPQSNRKVPIA